MPRPDEIAPLSLDEQVIGRKRVRGIVAFALLISSLLGASLIMLFVPGNLVLRLGLVALLILSDMVATVVLWIQTGRQIALLEQSRHSANPSVEG